MAQETWLVVAVAAAFLLLGIAASPLAWVALLHRRSRAERENERRSAQTCGPVARRCRIRLERCESALADRADSRGRGASGPGGLAVARGDRRDRRRGRAGASRCGRSISRSSPG